MVTDVNKQIRLYYLYYALVGTWFATGVLLFFSEKFLSVSTFGVIEAITFTIGLLANIPTGALADRFGRRNMVILGVILGGLGFFLWGFATTGVMIFLGDLLYYVGTAFQTGADDAMMYDYLKSQGKEDLWHRVTTNNTIIARVSFVIAIFIGGIAYAHFDRLPFLLRGLTFFLMLVPLYKLAVVDRFQPKHEDTNEIKDYFQKLKSGVQELFKLKIIWIVPVYALVQGIAYSVFTAGILRPILYQHAGLPINSISAAIAIALVFTILTLFVVRRYALKLFVPSTIFSLALICVIGLGMNLGNSLILSLIGLTILQVATYVNIPMLSVQINKVIDPNHRATTLSAASFLESIVYIIGTPVVGYMTAKGLVNEIVIGSVVLISVGLLLGTTLYKVGKVNSHE